MHKATLAGNPVRKCRIQLQQSMHDFADSCGIGYFALCITEGGCYESVPPTVVTYLKVHLPELDLTRLKVEYSMFQRQLRQMNFQTIQLELPDPDMRANPVRQLREHLQFGYAEFYKLLCINPGVLYRVEHDKYRRIPSQLERALEDVAMPKDEIEELDFRLTERYERVQRRSRSRV